MKKQSVVKLLKSVGRLVEKADKEFADSILEVRKALRFGYYLL